MLVRRVAQALLVVCLVSVPVAAQQAMRVSPTTLTLNDESFLTIYVSGLLETDLIDVSFSGPGGSATVPPNAVSSTEIVAWVPMTLLIVEGRYTVNVTATRPSGTLSFGPGYFDVEVADEEIPSFNLFLPEVVLGEATSAQGGVVTFAASSSDGTAVDCSPASGATFPIGTTIVNCAATNALAQTATGSFAVFVYDSVAPEIVVPDDISSDDAVVSFTVTATDAIDADVDITCNPPSGSTFRPGSTTVLCYAVDDHANYAFGAFTVTINNGGPVLTVPDDMTVEATSPAGAVVTYTATATEGGVVTCSPASGSTFAFGDTTVNCTATNSVGDDTDSFVVTVVDTTAPTIVSLSASPDLLWPPNHQMASVTVSAVTSDAADDSVVCQIIDITSNQPDNGTGDGDTAGDIVITGAMTADLRAERSGNADRVYKIIVECSDSSGNVSSKNTEVKVSQTSRRRSSR